MLEEFEGHSPVIAEGAYVHPAAVLIGEVVVAARSSVWPNTTLRADDAPIVIGSDTSIQDGSTVHATQGLSRTVVGDRVTVGHNVILHGCRIGNDVLVGMGSVVLDNAIIGDGALVAAGTVVPPGKTVAPNTVVRGNPMQVVRPCTDKDRALIDLSWKAYVKRADDYLRRDAP